MELIKSERIFIEVCCENDINEKFSGKINIKNIQESVVLKKFAEKTSTGTTLKTIVVKIPYPLDIMRKAHFLIRHVFDTQAQRKFITESCTSNREKFDLLVIMTKLYIYPLVKVLCAAIANDYLYFNTLPENLTKYERDELVSICESFDI